jgi:sulfite reductase alpha subunit-like flavoprotein
LRNVAKWAHPSHLPTTGQLAATDFGSFLKQKAAAAAGAGAAVRQQQQQQQQQQGPPLTADSVVVTILFGTEYGFSKEIAEKLADALWDRPPYWWV